MTAFVVELRYKGAVQIVREPLDALERLRMLLGIEQEDNTWHAVRSKLRAITDNAILVLHALDASPELPSGFLDVDIADDPDPFAHLRLAMSAVRSGIPPMMAKRGMMADIAADLDHWTTIGINSARRCRFLAKELGATSTEMSAVVEALHGAASDDDVLAAFSLFELELRRIWIETPESVP